jgi:hypothetical protein
VYETQDDVLHCVAPIFAVAETSVGAKLTPAIVMVAPPESGELLVEALTTGLSKVNIFLEVPTIVETVNTVLAAAPEPGLSARHDKVVALFQEVEPQIDVPIEADGVVSKYAKFIPRTVRLIPADVGPFDGRN